MIILITEDSNLDNASTILKRDVLSRTNYLIGRLKDQMSKRFLHPSNVSKVQENVIIPDLNDQQVNNSINTQNINTAAPLSTTVNTSPVVNNQQLSQQPVINNTAPITTYNELSSKMIGPNSIIAQQTAKEKAILLGQIRPQVNNFHIKPKK